MREGKKGPYRSSARWHAVRAEPISEDNASPKMDKVRIRRPYRPRTACGHVVVGGCRPVHLPSLIWGLLLCVLLAAIVLVRILDRALHGPLRPGDLLPDLHAAADDRQRYGAVSSQLADSPHRPSRLPLQRRAAPSPSVSP